jgi:glycosyltransferase involved in cell wall biosynthesis
VFRPAPHPRDDGKVVIGWVGSDTTAPYLLMIREALERLTRRHPQVEIQVVGGTRMPLEMPNLVSRRWALEDELETLRGFDIGIMPMPDSEWTRGKCGFKALLYMSVGVPPVCSPVGVTNDIIHDGINGLLATSTDEWVDKLSRLIEDGALRRQMGRSGRLTVEERFSLSSQAPRFLEALRRAAEDRPARRRALAS